MAQFSIKDIEYLTGIKAHTLRIWEQRYNLVEPYRTETNIRYYDDEQLKTLLNIGLLYNNGYKISKIASMDDEKLRQAIREISQKDEKHGQYIHHILTATLDLNEVLFERTLGKAVQEMGFENAFIEVVLPFLEKIGVLWTQGSLLPAQEHFISNLIIRKMEVAIDNQILYPKPDAKTFLLFLPEEERHEIGLLFCQYLIKKNGHRSVYLGTNVPMDDVIEISRKIHPDILITIFTVNLGKQSLQEYLNRLEKEAECDHIMVSGMQLGREALKCSDRIEVFADFREFMEYIESE